MNNNIITLFKKFLRKDIVRVIVYKIYIILVVNKFFADKEYYEAHFIYKHKKSIDWSNLKTFSEKIQWRKLYQVRSSDIYKLCSDKYSVREFVRQRSNCKLIDLLGVYKKWDDIEFEKLPDNFVIKCNHDSGSTFIVRNKYEKKVLQQARLKIERALSKDYYESAREYQYKSIDRIILVENFLSVGIENDPPEDYKVHCFHGKPLYIQVANFKKTTNDFYDLNWKIMDFSYLNQHSGIKRKQPLLLNKLIEYAEELSKPFDYVRIDLYIVENDIFFGELTFTPNGGYETFNPIKFDYLFGDHWKIKKKTHGIEIDTKEQEPA